MISQHKKYIGHKVSHKVSKSNTHLKYLHGLEPVICDISGQWYLYKTQMHNSIVQMHDCITQVHDSIPQNYTTLNICEIQVWIN